MFLLPIFVTISMALPAASTSMLSAASDILRASAEPRVTNYVSSSVTQFRALTIVSDSGSMQIMEVAKGAPTVKINGAVLPGPLSQILLERKLGWIRSLKQTLLNQTRATMDGSLRLSEATSADALGEVTYRDMKRAVTEATLVGVKSEGVTRSLILESPRKTNLIVTIQVKGSEMIRVEVTDNSGALSTVFKAASDSKRAGELLQILKKIVGGGCEKSLSR